MTETGPLVTWEPTTQRHPVDCNVCGTATGEGYARREQQGDGWAKYRFVCRACAFGVYDFIGHDTTQETWTRKEALIMARLVCLLTPHLATVDYDAGCGWHVEISARGETMERLLDLRQIAHYIRANSCWN